MLQNYCGWYDKNRRWHQSKLTFPVAERTCQVSLQPIAGCSVGDDIDILTLIITERQVSAVRLERPSCHDDYTVLT